MARSQSKSSAHRAQLAHRSVTTINTAGPKKTEDRMHRAFHFRKLKGKVVEDVEFSSSSDCHAISLFFQDKTCLNRVIDVGFSIHADYADRKTGVQRVLKKWPLLHAVRFRDVAES